MALSSTPTKLMKLMRPKKPQKPRKPQKQGAVVSAAVGALAVGGGVVSVLGSPAAAAAATATTAITVTAKADVTNAAEDTLFTVSGAVTGAEPGTELRLQRQQTPSATDSSPEWTTLPYTTFTDKDNRFSFPVKMEASGSYNLRILHPQDKEGPQTAFSSPFSVDVSANG